MMLLCKRLFLTVATYAQARCRLPPPPTLLHNSVSCQNFTRPIATWKFDVLEALFSDDYIHKTLPATANDPPKNKAEGIGHAKSIGKLLGYTDLKYEIFQSNEAPGSIWVHSRLYGDLPGGVAFNTESIYIFTLSSGDNYPDHRHPRIHRHQTGRGIRSYRLCCCRA
ncbi:hypothetical protein H4582DRAFT_2190254 [Lactarius indigo]|nr:hypothetical protein H4582DRAFT_2190254 [Lactarius indigo]